MNQRATPPKPKQHRDMPPSSFLCLPREVRDLIYEAYVTDGAVDGYFFDFQSGKLRTANYERIDLALTHTCRQVANEMRGLALQRNMITFTTVYSEDLRASAARFQYLLDCFHQELKAGFQTSHAVLSREQNEDVLRYFPGMQACIPENLREGRPFTTKYSTFGEVSGTPETSQRRV